MSELRQNSIQRQAMPRQRRTAQAKAPRPRIVGLGLSASAALAALVALLFALPRSQSYESGVIARCSKPSQASRANPVSPPPASSSVPAAPEPGNRGMASGQRTHVYGDPADFFIRQPIDYPGDMPKRAGTKISMYVYDLEFVKEAVRTGNEPGSRFEKATGRLLTDSERKAARAALQSFFDDVVPVMDEILDQTLSLEAGYQFLRPRRERLDEELRATMGLELEQFYALYPHIERRVAARDEIDSWQARPTHGYDAPPPPPA